MKINIDNTIIKCLYLAFIVTSYSAYIPSNIIDDVIIVAIGFLLIIKIIKKGFFNCKLLLSFMLFLLECVLAIFSSIEYSNNAIWSFISFIKIYILILLTFYLNLENECKNKLLKNFAILSIPNILLGFWQFYQVQIKGIVLAGKYEMINGSYFYRIQGGTGHPIYYAFLMILLITYFLYNSKFKFRYFFVIICFILCGLTYSSFSLVLAIVLIISKIVSKKRTITKILKKHSKIYISLAIICSVAFIYKVMLSETNTIRYVSTIGTLSYLDFNSFLIGRGFGSFVTANYSEAYIFRIIYENGFIGLSAFVLVMITLISKQIQNNDLGGMFICYIYILNCFINEGYIVPFILLIPIFCNQNIKVIHKNDRIDFNTKLNI